MDSCDKTTVETPAGFPDVADIGNPVQHRSIQSISPVALAYIGDAVFELYVRMKFLWPPQRIQQFHQQVVARVKAEQQADYLTQLRPLLNKAETDVVRRGRNGSSKAPRRLSAKIYRQATAFETLIGYLYITNQERLWQLLDGLSLAEDPPKFHGNSAEI